MNKSFEKLFEKYNIFSKYIIFKYNNLTFIIFIIIVFIILMKLCNCHSCNNNKENFLSIRINDKTTIIKKNNHLIDYYPLYNEDLKYRMNMTNEYFVKDTNKSYANFITNLTRNSDYYKDKISKLKYPFILRFEKDGYYVDYRFNSKIIQNKVTEHNWENYDLLETNTIITIYNYDYEVMNKIKSELSNFDYLYFQIADINQDMLYHKFNTEDIVNKYIINSVLKNIINNSNKNFKLDKKYINIINNVINNIIKEKISIEQINNLINENQIQIFLKNNNLGFIIDEIIKNNTIIAIETRDERFLFVYNEDDPEASIQLINLFKYIHNSENLDFLNDRISKKLRYFKVPLNVLRVLIKFKQYLKIF
jgi:hypothetical protein